MVIGLMPMCIGISRVLLLSKCLIILSFLRNSLPRVLRCSSEGKPGKSCCIGVNAYPR